VLLVLSPAAIATTGSGSVPLHQISGLFSDPRIEDAVAECSWAWASKAGIKGFGVVVDLLEKDNLSAMRRAIIELQDDAFQEVYNNFIQIPVCAALVVDLHINPNRLDDCATRKRLVFNSDNESASCQLIDFSAFDVPAAFLGSWTGTIAQQRPKIPPYKLKVTVL
jgi:hypothetical protein